MGTISGWTEGILLTITFAIVITFVLADLNARYGQNYNTPFLDNSTMNDYVNYMNKSSQLMNDSDVVSNVIGINIVSSYQIFKSAVNIVWGFISGSFLDNIGSMLELGAAGTSLILVFRIIWFLTLVWAGLYIFFKVIV